MSPEGLAHAVDHYLESLKAQAKIAEAFYYGRVGEGIEGILNLPEHVRLRIDQLIWESAKGEALDPTEEASLPLITDAVLYSMEERMGLYAE